MTAQLLERPMVQRRGIKLWVDDEKDPLQFAGLFELPDEGGWTWVKTSDAAKAFLLEGDVSVLALDNDLGWGQEKGRAIAHWLLERVLDGLRPPDRMYSLTFNPTAEREILATFDDIRRRAPRPETISDFNGGGISG